MTTDTMERKAETTTDKPVVQERPRDAFQAPNGQWMWPDTNGKYVPEDMVDVVDRRENETVRKILTFADALSAQIARFKGHTADDIYDLLAEIDQEHGVKKGGQRGNVTLTSYDGLMKVSVQRQDLIEFGPQLQSAKKLIDEYLTELTADAKPEIQGLINRAFDVDKEGQVNRAELFRLRRLAIDDERWREAMWAITEAIRVVGSKEYFRFYRRDDRNGAWKAVTIDLARA